MTTDWKALCAELAENVRYLLDCVADGDSDPVAIAECVQHLRATRILLSQPEPEGLTDEEIDALERRHWQLTGVVNESLQQEELFDYRAFLREGLARWGRPAVEPVPVSERLPGPEDCDTEGRCWWFRGDSPILNAYWDLSKGDSADPVPPTAWLPYYALPVPAFTEKP